MDFHAAEREKLVGEIDHVTEDLGEARRGLRTRGLQRLEQPEPTQYADVTRDRQSVRAQQRIVKAAEKRLQSFEDQLSVKTLTQAAPIRPALRARRQFLTQAPITLSVPAADRHHITRQERDRIRSHYPTRKSYQGELQRLRKELEGHMERLQVAQAKQAEVTQEHLAVLGLRTFQKAMSIPQKPNLEIDAQLQSAELAVEHAQERVAKANTRLHNYEALPLMREFRLNLLDAFEEGQYAVQRPVLEEQLMEQLSSTQFTLATQQADRDQWTREGLELATTAQTLMSQLRNLSERYDPGAVEASAARKACDVAFQTFWTRLQELRIQVRSTGRIDDITGRVDQLLNKNLEDFAVDLITTLPGLYTSEYLAVAWKLPELPRLVLEHFTRQRKILGTEVLAAEFSGSPEKRERLRVRLEAMNLRLAELTQRYEIARKRPEFAKAAAK